MSKTDYNYWEKLQSELDRKTLESVLHLQRRWELNQISLEAYLVGLTAVLMNVRGLVDEDVIAAIDLEINTLEPQLLEKKRAWH